MRGSRTRICDLFPWLFRGAGTAHAKDLPGTTAMGTELRGLGELAFVERQRQELSYTSLRDVMASQRRRPALSMEMEEISQWLNNARCQSPKNRLLERAAHAWLQPSVADLNRRERSFFSRCWLKVTSGSSYLPMMSPPSNFTPTFTTCFIYFPFLKWFDMSPIFRRLREPQPFPLLRD